MLSADGRYLWTHSEKGNRLSDLAGTAPPKHVSEMPQAISPDSQWLAFRTEHDIRCHVQTLILRRREREDTRLAFRSSDWGVFVLPYSFSPDSRYFAWSGQNGTITVIDIPALQEQVGEFEKRVLSK